MSFQAEDEVEPVNPARPSRQYPGQPIVGVGAVIVQDGKVVLVKRRFEPLAGQWSLPGGRLELGETLEAGLAREMLEETGLEVQVGPVVDVFDRILLDPERKVRYHYVLIDYLCRPRRRARARLGRGRSRARRSNRSGALSTDAESDVGHRKGHRCREDAFMGKGRALITGGSVGIGAALADVFAAHGHDLILVSRTRDKLEARGRAIARSSMSTSCCIPEDLSDPQGARRLHEAVDRPRPRCALSRQQRRCGPVWKIRHDRSRPPS